MTRLIAYMTTPGGLTGAPRRLLTLASVLRHHGIKTCIASQSESVLLRAAKVDGHETVAVDAIGPLALRHKALFGGGLWFRSRVFIDLLRQNQRLLQCIRRSRGDVIWIRGSKGIAFGALGTMLSRRPLIWDVDYELPSKGMIRWIHRFGLWAATAVVFQYSAAPSVIFGEVLAKRYRHKCHAIIPGIDLAALAPFRALRERRDTVKSKPFVILQVGTICDRKNQAVTLEALRLLFKDRPESRWELWLTYDAIQEINFEQRLREYALADNVRLLGWRDDIKDLMLQADILVMPSKDEGVPNAVQEAMAIGVPVLVGDAGGMPEIVANEVTGWVIDRDDPVAWARRILWCRDHRLASEKLGRNAANYAFRYFSMENWGGEYARVIKASAKSLRANH